MIIYFGVPTAIFLYNLKLRSQKCQSWVVCRDPNPISLQWGCQGEPGTAAGWLGHLLETEIIGCKSTARLKAANLSCLPQLCPQHTAGASKAQSIRCAEVQVSPSQAPELHVMIVSSPCQVEIFCECWRSCPSSIYSHCVGEKWVFLAQGCSPSWHLWFGAGWGVALWADRSCSLFSQAMPKTQTSFLFISCLMLLLGAPLSLPSPWKIIRH